MTPRSRHWSKTAGPKVLSGLLVGLGLLILAVTQILKPSLSHGGFIVGMFLALAGVIGMFAAGRSDTR
jgi:flagellar biosynthesis protein FliQ